MWKYTNVVLALVAACGVYFFVKLYKMRKEMESLPSPPRISWLLGNLNVAKECTDHFPDGSYPGVWGLFVQKKYNLGKYFYVDWWPLGPRFLFIADPDIVSRYVTGNQVLPKSPLETNYLDKFLGKNNLVSLEGAHWRSLRAMFNPGFAPNHIMTLAPYIVDACLGFADVLKSHAQKGDLFEMEEEATKLAIDVIGKVTLDIDFNSLKGTHPIVALFRERVRTMSTATSVNPFEDFDLLRPLKLWWNGRKLDRLLGEELDRKIAAWAEEEETGDRIGVEKDGTSATLKIAKARKRSVVDLAISTYQKEVQRSSSDSSKAAANRIKLSKSVRKDIVDSMKTFIFAGHDTTATAISYIFYTLHFHPTAYERVVEEVTAAFGGRPFSTQQAAAMIKSEPYVLNMLEYTTAVIKETMRIFPPVSGLREQPRHGAPMWLMDPEEASAPKHPLNGFSVYIMHSFLHRNEEYFPQPTQFIPTRFLPNENPFPHAKLFSHRGGKDAWRPFERGARACIGQELAMIEMKITLVLAVVGLDFTPEFDGVPVNELNVVDSFAEKSKTSIEGHLCYQVLKGSAKPFKGMPGRIRLR